MARDHSAARFRDPMTREGGSLIELTDGGRGPITLSAGEMRTFLETATR